MATDVFYPHSGLSKNALVSSMLQYQEIHERALQDPEGFWLEAAKSIYWKSLNSSPVLEHNFDVSKGPVFVRFLPNSTTNACYNALDVHVERGYGDKIAYYCEGNHPDDVFDITYRELLVKVCQFANVLKKHGVKRGDCVLICTPAILETIVAALACARIGAVHVIVVAEFSAECIAERIFNCKAKVIVLAFAFWRGSKLLEQKTCIKEALRILKKEYRHSVNKCIVLSHVDYVESCDEGRETISAVWNTSIDVWWHDEMSSVDSVCDVEWMNSEDPLFVLYNTASKGNKPSGIVHSTGGYLVYSHAVFKYIMDCKPNDIFFCCTDICWITGHSLLLYAPLMHRATSVLFSGIYTYPSDERIWNIVEKYKVSNVFITPTIVRSLMNSEVDLVKKHDLSSLKIVCSSGERLGRVAWFWLRKALGDGYCSIMDTYWQIESGSMMLTPFPGATPLKPRSVTFPFFGQEPLLIDDDGKVVKGAGEGCLVFGKPWPGIARTILGDHRRFEETYFSKTPGYFFTGDAAKRDKDGYFSMTGRVDDMVNISGYLVSATEIENVLRRHEAVDEAAVVSRPHPTKGESLYCFVTLKESQAFSDSLIADLKKLVENKKGQFAVPDYIQYASKLPKTTTGKNVKNILRKVALGYINVKDTSTLVDEYVVTELFKQRYPDEIIKTTNL